MSLLGILKLSGDKTQDFLQGQLTCDVRKLIKHGDYSYAACCDHRGRMIANFWVIKWHHDFLLALPHEMTAILKNHLVKYAVFSKVVITIVSELFSVTEVFENKKNEDVFITLPNPLRQLIIKEDPANPTEDTDFHQKNIEDNLVLLQPTTSLLFTPQMINLEKSGGVSFEKGCYVGQEIVARTEHLGTLKRHLQAKTIFSTTPIHPGKPYIENTVEMGVVADAIEIEKNKYAMLVVMEDRYI